MIIQSDTIIFWLTKSDNTVAWYFKNFDER